MLTDAHIHFAALARRDPGFPERYATSGIVAVAASHDEREWRLTEGLRSGMTGIDTSRGGVRPDEAAKMGSAALESRKLEFLSSFGIHPQCPIMEHARFLVELAETGKLAAIGEAGFDFFGDEPGLVRNEANESAQRAAFEFQLDLAERLELPLLLHVRKGMDLVFSYVKRLARLSSAIFHSYSGTLGEGEALLRRGVNAFFSFGAVVLNGHKRAVETCARLPLERLLSETDAPWQPPRGGPFCRFEDIAPIVARMAELRGITGDEAEINIAHNFSNAFPASARLMARGPRP